MSFAPKILKQGLRVVDFSADYRLEDAETYQTWYHAKTYKLMNLMPQAIYGLPERYRAKIRDAQLVANPGCYPTSAILAAMPLVAQGVVELDSIIVDSKSGISGAGPKPSENTHYPNRESNVVAYNIGVHRHTPEIEQELGAVASEPIRVTFTPHLVPMTRGILSTVYMRLTEEVCPLRGSPQTYTQAFYENEPFVRVLPSGDIPGDKGSPRQ